MYLLDGFRSLNATTIDLKAQWIGQHSMLREMDYTVYERENKIQNSK